jgi:ubiquinone/menaquinone biosynthesis C-methylase UbiE
MAFDTDADRAVSDLAPPPADADGLHLGAHHRAAAAAACRAAPSQRVPIPPYLLKVYWWTYVHPLALAVFDHMLIINLILLTNYNRMRDRALACFTGAADRVLQISCAYGDVTPRLAAKLAPGGGSLDVIDVLAVQLDNVRRKLSPAAPARLMNMDSTALALPDAAYDRVLLFFLLHEQPEDARRQTLAEALRVVRPGGEIVVVDFACPYRWNPFRYLWAVFLRIFEPFALDLWRHDLGHFLPADAATRLETARYFGGLFQRTTITREA